MELIRPSVEILEQGTTLEDMWKHIAKCTRVCYQSTPKENGETDEEKIIGNAAQLRADDDDDAGYGICD